jgi:glutathione S-transferase
MKFAFSLLVVFCFVPMIISKDILYDLPVSNYAARVRIILKSKVLYNQIERKDPQSIGGLKSLEYLKLNPQGKVPLLLVDGKYPIPESDTICRYIIDKYSNNEPSFIPKTIIQKCLSDQICRLHDIYITPLQGSMYKISGPYSIYGLNRASALKELIKQLTFIEDILTTFETNYPSLIGDYLCGNEISLADATLFPTMVFIVFMLPQFFNIPQDDFLGENLKKWWFFLSTNVKETVEVKKEIEEVLKIWKNNNRFEPIMKEMSEYYSK